MAKKIALGFIIALSLSVTGLILFFPFDSFVKEKIDNALGPDISIKNLKMRWSEITADDILIKTPAGTDFLQIKHLKLKPHIWGLLRKRLEIKEIDMDSPTLILKKTKGNKWLLPDFKKKKNEKPSITLLIKRFKVNNGNISFSDETKGVNLILTEAAIDMESNISLFQAGRTSFNAAAKLPSSGKVSVKAEGDIESSIFKGVLSIKEMDVVLLKPYMKGDVRVTRGKLSFDSNISLDKGYVRAPSILKVRDIDIDTKGVIVGVSTPLVIELAKKKGEIIVNFNVWGKSDNLQNDLKESFQKEVFAGIGRKVTTPIEDAVKGIRSLLPSKK
jgi:uncharacterized protein involved in outer membrane biogenesis